ncbi:MAG: hypothetical protein AMQ22_00008 [Candidatus Methanofastidiosum methylothiophilum]|uniref:Uncharacterized protein n=1 Tax=Candidatus Methanofastidiosum methylothiophilum TaxID=1705564 RepID=A0A150J999_9EURY|nr:MAG: hypothetical protein AMQ22_00008 [Candidatus Methanofastidiosum methylthiophilus]
MKRSKSAKEALEEMNQAIYNLKKALIKAPLLYKIALIIWLAVFIELIRWNLGLVRIG